jgi:hypothetical protein
MSKSFVFKMATTAALLFLFLFLLVRLNAEQIDWKKCFDSICLDARCLNSPRHVRATFTELFGSFTIADFSRDIKYYILIMPNLLIIWLTRRPWLAITSFLLAAAPALSVIISQSPMHDCDRKGADGALDVIFLYAIVIAPTSIVILVTTIFDRVKLRSRVG